MSKKLQKDEFEKIIQPLTPRDRMALREQEIQPEWLRENIARCQKLMTRDLWIGPFWILAYGVSLFLTRFSKLTIGIFVVGAAYFAYAVFSTGSFGQNRRRVQVYKELLKRLEN